MRKGRLGAIMKNEEFVMEEMVSGCGNGRTV